MRIIGIILVAVDTVSFLMFGNAVLNIPHDTSKGTDYLIGEYASDAFFGIME